MKPEVSAALAAAVADADNAGSILIDAINANPQAWGDLLKQLLPVILQTITPFLGQLLQKLLEGWLSKTTNGGNLNG